MHAGGGMDWLTRKQEYDAQHVTLLAQAGAFWEPASRNPLVAFSNR